jgi:hypothetical protein
MCKVKIYLFELSGKLGFPASSADRLSLQENIFLFRGCLPATAQRCRTAAGFSTSEFESDLGGISESNFDVQRGFSSSIATQGTNVAPCEMQSHAAT